MWLFSHLVVVVTNHQSWCVFFRNQSLFASLLTAATCWNLWISSANTYWSFKKCWYGMVKIEITKTQENILHHPTSTTLSLILAWYPTTEVGSGRCSSLCKRWINTLLIEPNKHDQLKWCQPLRAFNIGFLGIIDLLMRKWGPSSLQKILWYGWGCIGPFSHPQCWVKSGKSVGGLTNTKTTPNLLRPR